MSFRLPVTPFEQYALMDDSQRYPMVIAIRLTVSGQVDPAAFELAVVSALHRHPLLQSILDSDDDSEDDSDQLSWVKSNLPPSIQWFGEDAELKQPAGFDLKTAPGLRILCQTVSDGCKLTFQLHHACADGIGSLAFIDDVLIAYHNHWCQSSKPSRTQSVHGPVEHNEVDIAALSDRGNISRKRSRWSLPYRIAIGVARVIRFLAKQPMRIVGEVTAGGAGVSTNTDSAAARNCDDLAFSVGVVDRLRQAAAERGGTLNDVLLASAFKSLFAWQADRCDVTGFIRLGVPVNLRSDRHTKLPAANVVSVTFLDRTAQQLTDTLLAGITSQMNGIKSRKSATFVRFMQYVGSHKRLKRHVRSDRVFLSATLSNLGSVFTQSPLPRLADNRLCFANAVVEDVDVQGPVRGSMTVFFVVLSYAGRLKSCLSYDTSTFRKNAASELNQDFAGRLLQIDSDRGVAIPAPHVDSARATQSQQPAS